VTSAHFSPDLLPPPFFPPPPFETVPEDEQEQLVLAHMEEVKQIARSILRRLPASVQFDDLVQAGSLGLIDAARRFGPQRDLPFHQYARIRITGAIFDSLRELDWASRYFRTRQQKLDNATRALESKLGRKPDSDELANSMGLDLNTFFEFANAVQSLVHVGDGRGYSQCPHCADGLLGRGWLRGLSSRGRSHRHDSLLLQGTHDGANRQVHRQNRIPRVPDSRQSPGAPPQQTRFPRPRTHDPAPMIRQVRRFVPARMPDRLQASACALRQQPANAADARALP